MGENLLRGRLDFNLYATSALGTSCQQPGRQFWPHKAGLMGETSSTELGQGSLVQDIYVKNSFLWTVSLEAIGDSFTNFEHGGEWYRSFAVYERRPKKRFGKLRINQKPNKNLGEKKSKKGKYWLHRWNRRWRRRWPWKMKIAHFFFGF